MRFFQKYTSDQQIIEDCIKGKHAAQKKLYELYFNYAMAVASQYASDREDAIEVVNDAFIKVYSSLEKFDIELSFKAWFRKIVVFTAIDHYRKRKKDAHESLDNLYVTNDNIEPNVFSDIGENDILKCVQELPMSYRTVFVLFVVEGYKHHEIADMLGISEGTSKSNLSVAREKLKGKLSKMSKSYRQHG